MPRTVVRYALESSIENRVVADARRLLGVLSIKLTPRGQRAYPDRLFFIPGGRAMFIEFKRPGASPERLQKHVHKQLSALGYHVEVHDNHADAMASIRRTVDAARRAEGRG